MKLAIVAECFKYCQPDTEEIVNNGYLMVKEKFPSVSLYSIATYFKEFKRQQRAGNLVPNLASKRVGGRNVRNKLTPELTIRYREIMQDYANSWTRLTVAMLATEIGGGIGVATVHRHLKVL
jgi:hypothetical protein